jgi:hypothetical protein
MGTISDKPASLSGKADREKPSCEPASSAWKKARLAGEEEEGKRAWQQMDEAGKPLIQYLLGELNTKQHMLRNFRQIGPYHHIFINKDGEQVCEINFRIRFQDALANREPAIALDGIQVADGFLRQGWCTAVLKLLSTDLREGSPFKIRAVTLNAISDEMKAVLDKLKVDHSRGWSCVWDSTFDIGPVALSAAGATQRLSALDEIGAAGEGLVQIILNKAASMGPSRTSLESFTFLDRDGNEACKMGFYVEDRHGLARVGPVLVINSIKVKRSCWGQGWCAAVLKYLDDKFRNARPRMIRALVAYPETDEMKAALDQLKVNYKQSVALVWDTGYWD